MAGALARWADRTIQKNDRPPRLVEITELGIADLESLPKLARQPVHFRAIGLRFLGNDDVDRGGAAKHAGKTPQHAVGPADDRGGGLAA